MRTTHFFTVRCARRLTWAALLTAALLAPGARSQDLFGLGEAPAPAPAGPAPDAAPGINLDATMRGLYAAQGPAGGLDRHALRARLTPARPTPGVKTLILAFEGTGAFEPRRMPLVMEAYRRMGREVPDGQAVVDAAEAEIKRVEGRSVHWSSLAQGPVPVLLEEAALTGGFDWASFPSEEAEVLAGLDSITVGNIRRLDRDIARSVAGLPRGVVDARRFLVRYLRAWPEDQPPPRVVVLTHSSGGRAAVKCLEELKKDRIEVDLVYTIDPVRAAHEALKELLPQMIGQGTNYNVRKIPGADWVMDQVGAPKPVLPRVWSRAHKDHLYATSNARRWVSVYQTDDTEGLKIQPHHGIQGSKIRAADREQRVPGLKSDGHGAIGYAPLTLEILREELGALRKPQ